MGRPIYLDLDDTLITSIEDRRGHIVEIIPRSGVSEFLRKLSRHGDLFLLTHATRPHVRNAFRAIGPASKLFRGILSREDWQSIADQVEYLLGDAALTDGERSMLYHEIVPLAPRGFIFDDQPVDSLFYLMKTAVVGAEQGDWIQVPSFAESTDPSDLDMAYQEYRSRSTGEHASMYGRRARVSR